jgi:hypothetical protein
MLEVGISYAVAICSKGDVFLLKTVGVEPKPTSYVLWSPYGGYEGKYEDVHANYLMCALFSQKFESYVFYDHENLIEFLKKPYLKEHEKGSIVQKQLNTMLSLNF